MGAGVQPPQRSSHVASSENCEHSLAVKRAQYASSVLRQGSVWAAASPTMRARAAIVVGAWKRDTPLQAIAGMTRTGRGKAPRKIETEAQKPDFAPRRFPENSPRIFPFHIFATLVHPMLQDYRRTECTRRRYCHNLPGGPLFTLIYTTCEGSQGCP